LSSAPRGARTTLFIGLTSLHNAQGRSTMKRTLVAGALALAMSGAGAQEAKVNIGISGWTGFAPLTLAAQAGIFKKHGVDATIKKIPPQTRHLASVSGDVECAATTVGTWLAWNGNGVVGKRD